MQPGRAEGGRAPQRHFLIAGALALLGMAMVVAGYFVAAAIGKDQLVIDIARRRIESVFSLDPLWLAAPYFVALLIELVVLGYRQSALHRLLNPSRSARSDLVFFVLTMTGVISTILMIFSFGATNLIGRGVKVYAHTNFLHAIENPLLQFVAWLMIFDLLIYWVHRFSHTIPFWWELHKFHHSATEMTVLTGRRTHPVDQLLTSLSVVVPLALLGIPAQQFVLIAFLKTVQGALQHSMVNWRWGWVGDWVFLSPIAHRIHHSPMEEHRDKNFARLSPLWDRMFGTWYKGDTINQVVGINDNYFNESGIIYDVIESTRLSLRRLAGKDRLPIAPDSLAKPSGTSSVRS